MSNILQLEDFNLTPSRPSAAGGVDGVALEEVKLEAFERGFKAGWDDAVAAQGDATSKLSADLSSNLQDLSFSVHEARADLIKSLKPLMAEIVSKVLPKVAQDTLAGRINDLILDQVQNALPESIELTVAPDDEETVTELLSGGTSHQVTVRAETSLCAGQAFLKVGEREQEINLEDTLQQIGEAIEAFFRTNSVASEAAHG